MKKEKKLRKLEIWEFNADFFLYVFSIYYLALPSAAPLCENPIWAHHLGDSLYFSTAYAFDSSQSQNPLPNPKTPL